MLLPSKHLLSAFFKTLPSKNPTKNQACLYRKPLQAPSKNPSKKHLLLENLLRTLLRSVRLHDLLGVHPTSMFREFCGRPVQPQPQSRKLSGTESRIANRTVPRIAGRNRQKFRRKKQKVESNRSKVESRKIDSESPSESHPNKA